MKQRRGDGATALDGTTEGAGNSTGAASTCAGAPVDSAAAGCPAARRPADRRRQGATYREAAAALDTPGTVLGIGAAAGATSLPLSGRAPVRHATAVEADEELLRSFTERAEHLGVPARPLLGRWPDLAEVTRRRLCLPPSAATEVAIEVAEALRELGVDPDRTPEPGSSGREPVPPSRDGTAASEHR